MQEYLSKPLKPNALIQIILKCATLAEEKAKAEADQANSRGSLDSDGKSGAGSPRPDMAGEKRPSIDVRAFTMVANGVESPDANSTSQVDPLDHVR